MFRFLKFFGTLKLHIERIKTRYNQQLWEARRPLIEVQNQIDEEKKELFKKHLQIKFPALSKIFLMFLFLNFTILEIGQTLSYGIYAAKSKAENTKNGIIYETAMANYQSDIDNEGGVG